jgi:5'(3')-deoxyribonucleotidase
MKQLDLFPEPAPPRNLRVLCDVDGVLADFVDTFLGFVSRHYGVTYQRSAIDNWDPFAALGLAPAWGDFRHYVETHDLCRKMSPLGGAQAFWRALSGRYDVKIATSPQPYGAWLEQRSEWLRCELGIPFDLQIHLTDKADLVGTFDVLIDDSPHNCQSFEAAGGRAFCIAAPYNLNVAARRGTYAQCLAWLASLKVIA